MQFLSDVFIRCPDCDGRRYRPHILEIKLENSPASTEWSIADLLEATVDEAAGFLQGFIDSRHATRAVGNLKILQEVGLGYLRLGQPINTLSGGESQRLKLAGHLGAALANPKSAGRNPKDAQPARSEDHATTSQLSDLGSWSSDLPATLFLFDEPTTGLHFDDIRQLVRVFQRLVHSGHSVLVIEHNLDLIKCADWIIDLGPEAGEDGGRVVAAGTPEEIASIRESHTGAALRSVLASS